MLSTYRGMGLDKNDTYRMGLIFAPLGSIVLFYLLISQSTSCLISYSAFTMSIVFLLISLWMLCDILAKDQGPRAM